MSRPMLIDLEIVEEIERLCRYVLERAIAPDPCDRAIRILKALRGSSFQVVGPTQALEVPSKDADPTKTKCFDAPLEFWNDKCEDIYSDQDGEPFGHTDPACGAGRLTPAQLQALAELIRKT
jgi:hypothetical protein